MGKPLQPKEVRSNGLTPHSDRSHASVVVPGLLAVSAAVALVVAWLGYNLAPFHLVGLIPLLLGLLLPTGAGFVPDLPGSGDQPVVRDSPGGGADGFGRFRQISHTAQAQGRVSRRLRLRECAGSPRRGILNRYRYRIGEIRQMERRKVGILGATGMVGQRFIQLLSNHPWFEIDVAGGERSQRGQDVRRGVQVEAGHSACRHESRR